MREAALITRLMGASPTAWADETAQEDLDAEAALSAAHTALLYAQLALETGRQELALSYLQVGVWLLGGVERGDDWVRYAALDGALARVRADLVACTQRAVRALLAVVGREETEA